MSGVDVRDQDDFPVTDHSDGRLDNLRAPSDEYDRPRLAIGVPEPSRQQGEEYEVSLLRRRALPPPLRSAVHSAARSSP
jgi:hypothetical protein